MKIFKRILIACLAVVTVIGVVIPLNAAVKKSYYDVNGDDIVNVKDMIYIKKYMNPSSSDLKKEAADINNDGLINNKDIEAVKGNLGREYGEGLSVMSFNVWVGTRSDARNQRVIQMIKNYMPDTIGMQEIDPTWLGVLDAGIGSTYARVGEGRDGGSKGEHNPIYYNKEKFNLLGSGTYWLSDTPNVVSKHPSSSLNRIYTYAILQRKTDKAVVMHINTHFDHISEPARVSQAKLLGQFIEKYNDMYPIVVTGDFNTKYGSDTYKSLLHYGICNTVNLVDGAVNTATFTNYGKANDIIDFIFSNGSVRPTYYKVCTEKINGDFPSDHHPILVKYRLK